jgi:glucose-1-phosphate adenylyltransferase
MMNVLGIIFSYPEKDNLRELTKMRTLASLPMAGKYRIIDFLLSNFVNSNIFDVSIITKNNYHSLIDHVGSGKEWDLTRKRGGLRVLTPFASPDSKGDIMYNTRIEALAYNMNSIKRSMSDYVVLSGCSILYSINYEELLEHHISKNADITAVYTNGSRLNTILPFNSPFFDVDDAGRITDIRVHVEEKGRRSDDGRINHYDNVTCNKGCGMDVFIIRKSLLESLIADSMAYGRHDFYQDILQRLMGSLNIIGYEYTDIFMGVDTITSYMRANMSLLNIDIRNSMFKNVIYTKIKDSVPAEYADGCLVRNSMVSDGCKIEGTIENCILSRGVKIGKGAVIKNSIIMQNTTIMENVELNYVILDKDVIVRENRRLSGHETFPVVIEKASIV